MPFCVAAAGISLTLVAISFLSYLCVQNICSLPRPKSTGRYRCQARTFRPTALPSFSNASLIIWRLARTKHADSKSFPGKCFVNGLLKKAVLNYPEAKKLQTLLQGISAACQGCSLLQNFSGFKRQPWAIIAKLNLVKALR